MSSNGHGAAFAGTADALAAVRAGLAFLAAADAASLPAGELADCLRELEAAASVQTAARARVLAAFNAGGGFEADGHGSVKGWLVWQTRVTRGSAAGWMGWMRRLAVHPLVAGALAAGAISESWARLLCGWSDRLPPDMRGDADQILLGAAAGGADLADLAGLAEEMLRRCAPPDGDDGGFADRSVRLDVTLDGAGKLDGVLTPECAASLAAVLESLGKKAGPEDDRTKDQRDHDALEEAARRLVGSGCLPDVAGQPVQVQLHMTLDQLRRLPGAADAEAAWAAGRAAGDGEPGWVRDPGAAEGYACDAQLAPIVSGHLDPAALAAMTAAYLSGEPALAAGRPLAARTMRRLQDALARYAADVLSGPAGLAAFLRAGQVGFPPAVSLPLDVGAAVSTVPPHLRRAVIARDRHCSFPGCRQRPRGCHVHHLVPRAEGGVTALHNMTLLCPFHHLTAIHRWGWTLALNGDGTTTATSPDGRRILHSHGPPGAAAA